ncbi:MAG: DedA family protein [Verrucomicrobia bacterium]|nr:DedA family protein [Verrucomicrobiota bacterium]
MHALIALWFGWVRDWGYAGVIVLMAMESTIFPVPSEVVIPPAAYWASQGHMTLFGVILAGTAGSYIGSALTYWLARYVGRLAVIRFGQRLLITEAKIERAERFLQRYEAGGIFFARLLPVVRHLISIPAGVFRMNFGAFSVMTIVGSALWCGVLAWMGARVAERNPGLIEDPEKMIAAVKHESLWFVLAVLGMAALYALTLRLTSKRA